MSELFYLKKFPCVRYQGFNALPHQVTAVPSHSLSLHVKKRDEPKCLCGGSPLPQFAMKKHTAKNTL